jgi:hypothetical protein
VSDNGEAREGQTGERERPREKESEREQGLIARDNVFSHSVEARGCLHACTRGIRSTFSTVKQCTHCAQRVATQVCCVAVVDVWPVQAEPLTITTRLLLVTRNTHVLSSCLYWRCHGHVH